MTGRVAHYRVGDYAFSFALDGGDASRSVGQACGDLLLGDGADLGDLLDVAPGESSVVDFFSRLNPRVVDAHPSWSVFHAGVVELAQGAVISFGLSGAGKSTLTAALVQRGAGYLTDEAALIEPGQARVHPYAKPLSLSPTSLQLLGLADRSGRLPGRVPGELVQEVALRPSDLGGRATHAPVPLWGLCHVVRAPADAHGIQQLGPCASIMAMLPSYMCFSPERNALAELAELVRTHPVWEVRGGTPDDAATSVLGLPATSRPLGRDAVPTELPPVSARSDPAPRSASHLGPFSAPTRQSTLIGIRYDDGAVVLDRRTGEHLQMSPEGFDLVVGLDGSASLRDLGRSTGCSPSICVEFTRTLADRGWLQGYPRLVDLPVHPHVLDRASA